MYFQLFTAWYASSSAAFSKTKVVVGPGVGTGQLLRAVLQYLTVMNEAQATEGPLSSSST